MSHTKLTYVKERIYDELVYPDIRAQLNNVVTEPEKIKMEELFEEDDYLMKCLKAKVPDTYNFIRSLEHGASEMGEYE